MLLKQISLVLSIAAMQVVIAALRNPARTQLSRAFADADMGFRRILLHLPLQSVAMTQEKLLVLPLPGCLLRGQRLVLSQGINHLVL